MQKKFSVYFFILPLIICTVLLVLAKDKPIGDFGNYYYGSKIWKEGKEVELLYKDTHWFNEQVRSYGEENYFGNYAPVPPFSLVFYYPLTFLQSSAAKFLFNVVSILIICFSFSRFIKQETSGDLRYLAGFIVLLLPAYNNLVQGQSYLLITALVLEIYLAYKKDKKWLIAILISLLFHLKLFPVFILGYFMFRKEYKIVLFSVIAILSVYFLTLLSIGNELMTNYFGEIVPRMMKNEIIDPFYSGHQSVNIFLNDFFCFDALSNKEVVFHAPWIIAFVEGVFLAISIYFSYLVLKKGSTWKEYAVLVFFGIAAGRYITSYSLILLLPFTTSLINFKRPWFVLLVALICFNIPLHWFGELSGILRYPRLILMLVLFVCVICEYRQKINYASLGIICLLVITYNLFSGKRSENHYFQMAKKPGIIYDFYLQSDFIMIKRCMGSVDYLDSVKFNTPILKSEELSEIKDKSVKKAYRINDTQLIYLSDYQQGIGMYKLRSENY